MEGGRHSDYLTTENEHNDPYKPLTILVHEVEIENRQVVEGSKELVVQDRITCPALETIQTALVSNQNAYTIRKQEPSNSYNKSNVSQST